MESKARCRWTNEPLTYDWLHPDIPMSRPDMTDVEVASKVRMLMRSDMDHEGTCMLARDRIMALSKAYVDHAAEVAELREQLATALAEVERLREGWKAAGAEAAKYQDLYSRERYPDTTGQ